MVKDDNSLKQKKINVKLRFLYYFFWMSFLMVFVSLLSFFNFFSCYAILASKHFSLFLLFFFLLFFLFDFSAMPRVNIIPRILNWNKGLTGRTMFSCSIFHLYTFKDNMGLWWPIKLYISYSSINLCCLDDICFLASNCVFWGAFFYTVRVFSRSMNLKQTPVKPTDYRFCKCVAKEASLNRLLCIRTKLRTTSYDDHKTDLFC